MFVGNSFFDHMKLNVYMFGSSMKFRITNKLDKALIITKNISGCFLWKTKTAQ